MSEPDVLTALTRALIRAGANWDSADVLAAHLLDEIREQKAINGARSYAAPLFVLLPASS